jgi:hypothetical protein
MYAIMLYCSFIGTLSASLSREAERLSMAPYLFKGLSNGYGGSATEIVVFVCVDVCSCTTLVD